MAPERFSNDEVTYRADIYALACVLHECLTGAPPYRADSAGTLVTAHLMDPIPRPSVARAGIPKAFDAVIARGMAKKAEDRYASAGDLALAAHEALSTPDRDHAADILRRSQEATLPAPPTAVPSPTMPATAMAAPPRPVSPVTPPPAARIQQTPPRYPPASGSGPSRPSAPAGPWAPASGPIPAASPGPRYYQGGGGWGGAPPATTPPQRPASATPWGQGTPPARDRNPWPFVAAVAIVLVVVVAGVGIWVVTRPKPKPPPKPISEDRLSSLLLSPSEINAVMGSSSMQPGKPITSMDSSSLTLSLPECQGALYTSQDPVYAGTGYTGISGLVSSEPGDNYDHWVNQAVVTFPSTDKARAFVQTSANTWKNCQGKTVTVTNKSKTYRWTFGEVNGGPPRITLVDTQEGADGWECQRAMSVANNVVVDINACGYRITDQGGQIADKIVAKINKETTG
ncbi:sensor domain-containing protein [Mycobacterium shinjukuense]|nr:sensor domain-containing protein [Mycobacterium shinjukuense]